ncbi:MAG: hypothetical protein JW936_09875 [Sedimentisphaerales bacterium]|nr:hypothetical protein [Sedimentisphaerales bacterium]
MEYREAKSGSKLYAYVMCFSVLALFLPRSLTDRLDHLVCGVLSPFWGGGRMVSLMVSEPLEGLDSSVDGADYAVLLEAWERARVTNENLRQLLAQQREVIGELSGLPQEFGMAGVNLILADVVGSDSSNSRRMRTLNQGTSDWGDRIRREAVVLSPLAGGNMNDVYSMCVVGRVSGPGPWTSTLQLLNDRGFRLGVLIVPAAERGENWVARGVLTGRSDGTISVNMVQCEYAVEVGDVVLAESRDFLPVPMLVGWISRCDWDDRTPVMWDIEVRAALDLESISRVAIVDMSGGNDRGTAEH